MNGDLFSSCDSLLFVGEGNFSFALSFKRLNYDVKHITATCFEKDGLSETTLSNMEALKCAGVNVYTGIDATKLTSYPELLKQNFNGIIFNFPHVGGKMKIDKNRELLKNFFASCDALLALNDNEKLTTCRVLVSLCKGQGGTPADGKYLRSWGDSWQVVEMAAMCGMVLKQVIPFDHNLCPEYSSVGYRSRENWFHTEKALVHVFQASPPVLVRPCDINEKSLAQVETIGGTIFCERFYVENSDFCELENGCFKQIPQEHSLELSLFQSLYSFLLKSVDNLEVMPPTELPLHCNLSDSKIPCICKIENVSTDSWLRGSMLDVVNLYVDKKPTTNPKVTISHGCVFQAVDSDFSIAPCRQQAVIVCSDIDRLIEEIIIWISNTSNIRQEDLKIQQEKQWTLHHGNDVLLEKRETGVVIEFSTLAILKHNLHGFRDLKEACSSNDKCIFASVYPRSHVLDVCFTEHEDFSEDKLWVALWRTLGHWIIKVELQDRYVPDNKDWISRCYRIWYRSSKEALSRTAAINLHQVVLPELLIASKIALKVH